MDLRKFQLPLLLLTVALPPADAGAISNSPARANTQSVSPAQPSAAKAGAAGASRRKRRDSGSEQCPVSETMLAQVGDYLRCQAAGASPDATLSAAWDDFYAWCDASIRRYAASCRLRGADIDDCAQEVWADLIVSLRGFQLDTSRGNFSSWLYRVVQNNVVDMKRRQIRRPALALSGELADSVIHGGAGPLAVQEQQEDQAAVREAMAQLAREASPESYQVLHLRSMEGLSVREVSDALQLTPEQVWAREHRMKRKLQNLLTQTPACVA